MISTNQLPDVDNGKKDAIFVENADRMNTYGIITGDIVGFTKLTPEDRSELMNVLHNITEKINDARQESEKIKLEIYRGDAFQIIIPQANESLRIALLIRLGLISKRITSKYPSSQKKGIWDARLSIGIGAIDCINETLSTSDGEAFHNSGRAFDMLKKSDRLAVRTPWQEINQEFDVECFMADTIIRKLTDKQAEITYQYIFENNTQKSLAQEMKMSPQAVNKSLQHGGSALQEFIRRFEVLIENTK